MIFNLEPSELQAIFSALTTAKASIVAVTEKLTEQYQANVTPVPEPEKAGLTE